MRNLFGLAGLLLAASAPVAALDVEIGAGREDLSGALADWRSVHVAAEQSFGERRSLRGSWRQTERFGADDHEWAAGLTLPLSEVWTVGGDATISPSHRVLPEWSFGVELHRRLDDGWGLAFGGRHTEYASAETQQASLGLERYFGSFRAAYMWSTTRLSGAGSSPAQRLQLTHYYAAASSVGVLLGRGREAENVPPLGVIRSTTDTLAVVGRHWLDRDWALAYEVGLHQQGDFYRRRGVQLALRRVF